ncbi:MAG: hypothetical protein COU72_02120 [Parcubacteria group bacterium CG10_big_fil_rev_8_21_14_0_10_41_35]|nr:MAG: hypothetical protein COU72_02120 [Parcubacteria group bacterium CG10_big_fil_rev_8_21_14_0_10_41_35]
MPKKNKKKSAKDIFEKYIAREITGETSERTIEIFCSMDYNNFYNLAKKYKLEERQVSSLIGFKDEFLVKLLITQIISENGLDDIFYCKKVTANEKSGLSARAIKLNGGDKVLTIGGDCVIFRKSDNKPLMIIECKEYIDMIRMKELIGESRIIKDEISHSVNLLEDIKFCVFSEVLELTEGWAHLLDLSDLKHKIDDIFVIRDGKRKDKSNKPVKENLEQFKKYIQDFLRSFS